MASPAAGSTSIRSAKAGGAAGGGAAAAGGSSDTGSASGGSAAGGGSADASVSTPAAGAGAIVSEEGGVGCAVLTWALYLRRPVRAHGLAAAEI